MIRWILTVACITLVMASCGRQPRLDPADIGIEMVELAGGTFVMGDIDSLMGETDELPPHEVTVSPFLIGATEVTQRQYFRIMGDSAFYFEGGPNLPADRVSWRNAALFCNALSDSAGLEPCYDKATWRCDFTRNGFRLPTEAEWEFAARGGTTTRWFTGDSVDTLDDAAWYRKNSGGRVHPVAEKTPNPFGLYDIAGNVFEWCNDWYEIDYYERSPKVDPRGPADGTRRVRRDGGAIFAAHYMRSAARGADPPLNDVKFVGFRLARNFTGEN